MLKKKKKKKRRQLPSNDQVLMQPPAAGLPSLHAGWNTINITIIDLLLLSVLSSQGKQSEASVEQLEAQLL